MKILLISPPLLGTTGEGSYLSLFYYLDSA